MLRLKVAKLMEDTDSQYTLVVAVAKRARQIAEKNEESGNKTSEKAVRTAINDFYEGKVRLVK